MKKLIFVLSFLLIVSLTKAQTPTDVGKLIIQQNDFLENIRVPDTDVAIDIKTMSEEEFKAAFALDDSYPLPPIDWCGDWYGYTVQIGNDWYAGCRYGPFQEPVGYKLKCTQIQPDCYWVPISY